MDQRTKAGMNDIDVQVGANVRAARKALGMSQTTLAETLGLTFQQIQKYERGTNRISASTLWTISQVLGRPVESLFDGVEGSPADQRTDDQRSFSLRLIAAGDMVPELPRIPDLDRVTRRSLGVLISAAAAGGATAH